MDSFIIFPKARHHMLILAKIESKKPFQTTSIEKTFARRNLPGISRQTPEKVLRPKCS